jgi:hypothetical protein
MPNALEIGVILVPAGAEYQAVSRAMKSIKDGPPVVPILAGPQGATRFLQTWEEHDISDNCHHDFPEWSN